ncbi:MAG: ABC transporter ATP-binding protein [Firmicutes bacterium]|nr:ABC transporter ATP-binding protein [Bacillota bacterium]
MKRMYSYLKPYIKYVGLAVGCMIIDVLAEIVQPVLMARIVGPGIQGGNMQIVWTTGIAMIAVALICIAAAIGNSRFSAIAGAGFAANLRSSLFDQVQEFSFKNIDTFSTASLTTRLTNDVTQLQNTCTMGMRLLIRAPLMLVFSVVMAIQLSPQLSVVLAVATPVLLISVGLIIRKAMPMFNLMQKGVDQLNRTVQENVTNVRVVKSFVSQEHEKEKFDEANDNLMNRAMNAMNLVILNMPVMMMIMNISTLTVLWVGGKMIIGAEFDVATLNAFISYIFMILMSLMMVSMLFIMLSRATASYNRIKEVLETEIDLTDIAAIASGEASGAGHKIRGLVEFDGVKFHYNDNGEEVLENITFTAQPGQVVAIIGGTGAGKSSLIQLIPRLYDVTAGSVKIDGIDVRQYPLEELRSQIGMVLQKNTLFSGTIAENLRWGNENATDDEIRQAAEAACAADFIEGFPDKYETWIDQGGVNVSGGQKQRLCIARAMLKKPPILILDDSTSAVDTATEAKIRQAFHTTLKDTTTFIIAQRISSVQDADQIIVLDDGKIVGMGNHTELLKSCEEYQEIYESQMGKGADE